MRNRIARLHLRGFAISELRGTPVSAAIEQIPEGDERGEMRAVAPDRIDVRRLRFVVAPL
ncbi:MAG: hypothetical protein ACRENA_01840 [Vulcanimicrobiaceae bacterium]